MSLLCTAILEAAFEVGITGLWIGVFILVYPSHYLFLGVRVVEFGVRFERKGSK